MPTLWRVVLANPDVIGPAGARVRWIEIGSQYMARDEKEAMKRLFPNAHIVQHYGLTEASRSVLLYISATEGPALESVGRAAGSVEVAIGEGGAIRVRGPHVADGALVTEAGIEPLTDADGWLTTSDRGPETGVSRLRGPARRADQLWRAQIDPAQFEQRLAGRLGVPDAVAVGRIADPLRGERVLVVTRRDAGVDRKAVVAAAADIALDLGLVGTGALAFREADAFPRTATGKIADRPRRGIRGDGRTGTPSTR